MQLNEVLWLIYEVFVTFLVTPNIKKCTTVLVVRFFAERSGFEPEIPFWSIHAFQACLLSHSSISPDLLAQQRYTFLVKLKTLVM